MTTFFIKNWLNGRSANDAAQDAYERTIPFYKLIFPPSLQPRYRTVMNVQVPDGVNMITDQRILDSRLIVATSGGLQDSNQGDWRWCHKCHGLYFAGNTGSVCPAGGTHDLTHSGDYQLLFDVPGTPAQDNWRWCHKCQGLYFAGNSGSRCPAGGAHDKSGSADYYLFFNTPSHPGQKNWRWCHKCQGLFFAGNTGSVCPAGGAHDLTNSGDYSLIFH